jgi:hypothetical protein
MTRATRAQHGTRPRRRAQAATAHGAFARPTVLVLLAWACAACGAPPGGGGPPVTTTSATDPVLITSPVDGSFVSGATYFAVQLLDPAALPSLTLRVGGQVVTPSFPGETPLRVFLIPRDHPEGPLTLTASALHDGQTFTARVEVVVVHQPPSSATVGARGAVLGDVEANGAISTVSVPGGVAQGARVDFEAVTQAEVKARTGVDYDALGVTFLGAQEIRSTLPTGDQVTMTSGGFGPMVQSGQVVVSYRIAPDMGRGVGELMVINGASVAPNGDIVSDPMIRPQVSEATAASAAGVVRTALAGRASTTLPAAPVGTQLRFLVAGLNHYAVHGYAVRFLQGSTIVEVPALVGSAGDGRQYLLANVPDLAPGGTSVELYSVASERAFMTFTMSVTAAPTVADPKALVDASYARLRDEVDDFAAALAAQGIALDVGPLTAAIVTARAYWAGRSASDPELVALARRLAGAGVTTSGAHPTSADRPRRSSGGLCLLEGTKFTFDELFAKRAFQGDRFETGMRGLAGHLTLDYLDRFADRLEGTEYDCDPIKDQLCEAGIGPGCGGDDDIVYPPGTPNGPWPRPFPRSDDPFAPSSWTTGMGSVPALGGPLGGSGGRSGGGAASLALAATRGGATRGAVERIETGRYTVRVLVNEQPWPFASDMGRDGYFYLPAIAAGLTSTLVISDRQTLGECVMSVTGRTASAATAVYVDLDACVSDVDPGDFTILWVGGTSALATAWNDSANWSPQRVPDASDDVLIPSIADVVVLPTGTTQVRSITSLGRVRIGDGTLVASQDADLRVVQIDHTGAGLSAGGTLEVDTFDVRATWHLPDAFVSLRNLLLRSPGALHVPHTLTIAERLEFQHGGTLRGNGTVVLAPGGAGRVERLPGVATPIAALNDALTLEIDGTFDVVDHTLILFGTSGIVNRPGGTLRLTRDPETHSGAPTVRIDGSSTGGPILNQGTMEVGVDHPGTYNLSPALLHNTGTITIGAGALLQIATLTDRLTTFLNEGTVTGPGALFRARASAQFIFTHALGATLDVATLRINSDANEASLSLLGEIAPRTLDVYAGRVTLPHALTLERLIVGSVGTVTLVSEHATIVSDELYLGASTLSGSGSTRLAAGGTGTTRVNVDQRVSGGHSLVNAGTFVWSEATDATRRIQIDAGSEIVNEGTFVVRNDLSVQDGGTFVNRGTLRKEVATGTSNWTGVCFDGTGGQVVLETGSITFTTGC